MGGTSGTKYSCTNPPGVIGTGSPPHGLWVAPVSIPELLHPLWEAHAGLGMNACAVWSIVRKHRFITSTQIAKQTGRQARQIRTLLHRLAAANLVAASPDHHWQVIGMTIDDLDSAARSLGLDSQRHKRQVINAVRRSLYERHLDLRRSAWAEAHTDRAAGGKVIDFRTGEALKQDGPVASDSDAGQPGVLRHAT